MSEVSESVIGIGRPDLSKSFKHNLGICPSCDGHGYTAETASVIRKGITKSFGSGCPSCRGTGKATGGVQDA